MEKGLCVYRRALHKQVFRLRQLASKGQIKVGQVEGRTIRSILMVPVIFALVRSQMGSQWRRCLMGSYRMTTAAGDQDQLHGSHSRPPGSEKSLIS